MRSLGNGDDEGANGMVFENRGNLWACTVQGKADGGWAEPTTELENNNGEKIWTFKEGEERAWAEMREAKKALEGKDKEI